MAAALLFGGHPAQRAVELLRLVSLLDATAQIESAKLSASARPGLKSRQNHIGV
jgi:hypothetical protein